MPLKKKRNKREKRMDVKVENVNVEIDYEKLAKAIVTAQNIVKEQEQKKEAELLAQEKKKDKKQNKKGFFNRIKLLYGLFTNKIDTKGEATSMIMPGVTSIMALIFSKIFSFVSFLLLIGSVLLAVFSMSWENAQIVSNIVFLLVSIAVTIIIFFFSFIFKIVANDINKTEDKHYVLSVFSALAGFGALIVSLVALLKGVG
ncbi:MAG: hypothetical protein IKT32_08105 [Clostridia bacterium]|nr:hypothetical protein [Clostridia bacterium]